MYLFCILKIEKNWSNFAQLLEVAHSHILFDDSILFKYIYMCSNYLTRVCRHQAMFVLYVNKEIGVSALI